MNEWLSPAEVAGIADRHVITVRRALECGELHGHQRCRGGRWRVARAAVDAWIRGADGEIACGCKRPLRRVA